MHFSIRWKPAKNDQRERCGPNLYVKGYLNGTKKFQMRFGNNPWIDVGHYPQMSLAQAREIIAIERGLKLCAPIHDALLIEAPLDDIDGEVARLKSCIAEASEAVLGDGKICRVDAEIVRYPDRYMDENGHVMWSRIMHILNEVQF